MSAVELTNNYVTFHGTEGMVFLLVIQVFALIGIAATIIYLSYKMGEEQ